MVCLQERGEYPRCKRSPLNKQGLSYSPEELSESINFTHFPVKMEKYDANNFPRTILPLLKVIDMSREGDRSVYIHSHAGQDRAALVVCAYLVYCTGVNGSEALKIFDSKRYGSSVAKNVKILELLNSLEACKK